MALLKQGLYHNLSSHPSAGLSNGLEWKFVVPVSSFRPMTAGGSLSESLERTRRATGYRSVSPLASGYQPEKYEHCGYLAQALQREEIDEAVGLCVETLKGRKFDTIAFRGLSGALIAPIVAHILSKEIIVVRKKQTDHSNHRVEGHLAAKRYVILDDFISGGETVREIILRVNKFAPSATLWGGMLYTHWKKWLTPKELRERVKIE